MQNFRVRPNAEWTGSGLGPVGKFMGEASWVLATVAVFFLALSPMAAAQTSGVKWSLGAGVGAAPDYEGSDNYEPIPLLRARGAWQQGYTVEVSPDTIGAYQLRGNVLPDSITRVGPGRFRFGPLFNLRLERDDVEDDDVDDLKKVDTAAELGAFAGYDFELGADARSILGLNVQFAGDVSDSHNGWILQPGADFITPLGSSFRLNARVFGTYASEGYMNSYFGIGNGDARRSGLDTFDADSGFKDVGLRVFLDYNITQNWQIGALAGYSRLVGDAEDSPVVDDVGDADQIFGGLLVGYQF